MDKDMEKEINETLNKLLYALAEQENDDRLTIVLKFEEFKQTLQDLIVKDYDTFKKVKGRLTPLISLIAQSTECAKDILKDME